MKRTIPAGLLDSGFAALATFLITIFSARTMETDEFGFFAIFWAAFLTAAIVPAQLVFQPWEVAATRLRRQQRISYLRRALVSGFLVAVLAGIAAAGLAWTMTDTAPRELVVAFASTLVIAAAISPIQDYVRRMLHVAGLSGRASLVSCAQLVGAAGALAILTTTDVAVIWMPFTALSVANLLSASFGFWLARGSETTGTLSPPRREVARSGAWLLVLGLIVPVVGMVVNWLVLVLVGPVVLGLAEAARIVGRPVLVVTNGLGLALRPRSYEAAGEKNESNARRVRRAFAAVTIVGGVGYSTAVAFDWPGNLMMALLPKAFDISGLVLAICLANVLVGVTFPARYELIAAKKEGFTTGLEFIGQVFKVVAAGGASILGGFVIPLGDALLGLVRLIGLPPAVRRIYRVENGAEGPSTTSGALRNRP